MVPPGCWWTFASPGGWRYEEWMEEGNLQGIMALQGQPWSAEEGLEVCVWGVCVDGAGARLPQSAEVEVFSN